MQYGLFIGIAIMFTLIVVVISIYNQLIRGRMKVQEAWSGIEVQLKRRYDLIPNLAQAARSFATHEVETLDSLEQLRQEALKEENIPGRAVTENQISSTLQRIFGIPDNEKAGASDQYYQLQNTMIDLEDHIQRARRYYNALVRDHNHRCQAFPSGVIATLTGIKTEPFFDVDDEETEFPPLQV